MVGLIVCWVIVAVLWCYCGYCGFTYWWCKTEGSVEGHFRVLRRFCSIMGPGAWYVGWLIHGR
jgi:hypothetical protein